MQTLPSLDPIPLITIVCCVHGDERFGLQAFHQLSQDYVIRKNTRLILANEEALEKNVRFIESDLNRSFPGKEQGAHEERLAHALIPLIEEAAYLLDIHTTISDIRMTPIVCQLEPDIQNILTLTDSSEVILVNSDAAKRALIGHTPNGVSLEFGEAYAQTPAAFTDILRIIQGLTNPKSLPKRMRQIFSLEGMIPNSFPLPAQAKNFQFIPELMAYPFLLHERAYAKTAQGLKVMFREERMM